MLTQTRLRELLDYDENTGLFRWRKDGRKARAGAVAGTQNVHGYIVISVDCQSCYAHRLAFLWVNGVWPTNTVDHLNGARNDNRWGNLRDVERRVNCENVRVARTGNKVGLLGVTLIGRRYQASIGCGGKTKKLGYFDTAQQAAQAYIDAKRLLHPGCTL